MIGQRHYDVQLMGGAALHFGWIAEMKTGEGKTLVSTLPVYLNGLTGKGMHLITVNDYLASSTPSGWAGSTASSASTSASIIPGRTRRRRRSGPQYACDITYGTNNEFGFDYLRDNMAMSLARQGRSGATSTPSSTRSTRSSSTRPARR